MARKIRPEISAKNRYWISKHRFYELKHFCLQYPEWREAYRSLDGFSHIDRSAVQVGKERCESDPTGTTVQARLYYRERMEMIEDVAKHAAKDLYLLLLYAVTEEVSYEYLRARKDVPCSKDTWYTIYRYFFWLLDKARK